MFWEDVDDRIQTGEFRLDLYQRLAGVVIRLPALHERREDLVPLGRAFAAAAGCRLSAEAEEVLMAHDWPGNVRELKGAVQRAGFLGQSPLLEGEVMAEAIDLGLSRGRTAGTGAGTRPVNDALVEACRMHGWDVARTAQALGLGRATLYRRLREAGIDSRLWRTVTGGVPFGPGA